MRHACWFCLFTLLGVLLVGRARASGGFDTAYFGGPYGQAVGDTPFAVYFNPAALTLTRRVHVALDVLVAFHSMRYRRTETTVPEPADARGANLGQAKLFDVVTGPALAGSFRIGELTLGAGLYAPVAGSQTWDGNDAFRGNLDYPGAQDGPARFHLIEGTFTQLNATLAASYRIRSIGLSVGAGANLNYTTLALVRAVTVAFDDAIADNAEARTDIEAAGVTGSFSLGLLWQSPEDMVAAGVSYQAPPGLYDGQTLEGRLRTSFGGNPATNDVDLHQSLPDVVRWGVRVRPVREVELRMFGDYTRWSLLERQCLTRRGAKCDITRAGNERSGSDVLSNHERRWRDTFAVNVGASYHVTPKVELLAGIGYDSNAIPDGMLDASLVDSDDFTGTLGGRFRLGKYVRLLTSYAHTTWLSRDTTGKSQRDQLMYPTRMPSSGGEYERWLGIFTCLLETTFD